jgi:HTH-type transcriptional regulator/antitoxin MqsA
MKCPSCAAAELLHDTRDMPYTYKGESTLIPGVTGEFCPACDESILNVVESRRAMSQCLLTLRKWQDQAAFGTGEIA